MYKNIDINYGIQVVFSTIPNQAELDFEKDIESNYYERFKDNNDKDSFLYKPLKFYMLGDYDVCYITLINNFKFSHRLFEPKNNNNKYAYNTHTFQSLSGFALNKKTVLEELFSNPPKNYFVGIINLKLNNGLLIGNGLSYIEELHNFINKNVKVPFLLLQTFSWFELSLLVFVDNPNEIATILKKLRIAEFQHLESKITLNNSLYHSIYKKDEKQRIKNTSLFSDTHTYFGFNKDLISGDIRDSYIKEFIKKSKTNKIALHTTIEWHVKPGHISQLEKVLKKDSDLKKHFKFKKKKFVLGKSDYLLKEKKDSILSNFYLIRNIHRHEECNIFEHARKIRSYVFFNVNKISNKNNEDEKPLSWENNLRSLAVSSENFQKIDKSLKALKISRQVRIKILKIFSNYNNGIQDPILFPYFLDFYMFIQNLIGLINFEKELSEKSFFKIKDLESKLNNHIKIFQEGYNVRFINGYQFENISDFNLDFNSSIQLLLTSYGTLVYEYGKLFFKGKNYYPIIQLNDIDTISNYLSINYSIHHLTSPEFVFTTLLKEILNHMQVDNDNLKDHLESFQKKLPKIKEEINESYLDEMVNSKMIDLNYFIIDAVRFSVTFNDDFLLFQHWFWTYNFQNSALFNSNGMFNEHYLRMEMLRLMLIKKHFRINDEMECPSPELFTYWERHFKKIDIISEKLMTHIKKEGFGRVITSIVDHYLSSFNKINMNLSLKNKGIDLKKIVESIGPLDDKDTVSIIKKYEYLTLKEKESTNRMHDLERLTFKLLNGLFDKNKKGIISLKRSWEDGEILTEFNQLYKDRPFAIDQTGGVFFYNTNSANEYFTNNANYLLTIIDFSYKQKKEFILDKLKK